LGPAVGGFLSEMSRENECLAPLHCARAFGRAVGAQRRAGEL
jgi:hypothetical protein